jgi:DNA-binding NtrC family response regulator
MSAAELPGPEPDSAQTAGLPPILVVDDEPIVLTALRETLRSGKYDCVICSDARAALELIKQREFSIIISDHRMPGLSGLELMAEARRLRPEATRVLVTAVLSTDTLIQSINQGEIFRFILKPWGRDEFLATIQHALQRFEFMRQNTRLQAEAQGMERQLADYKSSLEHQTALIAQQARQIEELRQTLAEQPPGIQTEGHTCPPAAP